MRQTVINFQPVVTSTFAKKAKKDFAVFFNFAAFDLFCFLAVAKLCKTNQNIVESRRTPFEQSLFLF